MVYHQSWVLQRNPFEVNWWHPKLPSWLGWRDSKHLALKSYDAWYPHPKTSGARVHKAPEHDHPFKAASGGCNFAPQKPNKNPTFGCEWKMPHKRPHAMELCKGLKPFFRYFRGGAATGHWHSDSSNLVGIFSKAPETEMTGKARGSCFGNPEMCANQVAK